MNILWDDEKNAWLKKERKVSFEEIAVLILEGKYLDIVIHPKRTEQKIFILPIKGYTYAIPFVMDKDDNIVLKTAFPSRKFHKKYARRSDESKT